MNAEDFKRDIEKLRKERDLDDKVALKEREFCDETMLQTINQAIHRANASGQRYVELGAYFGDLSDNVLATLRDSGCDVNVRYTTSRFANDRMDKGYIIHWYP